MPIAKLQDVLSSDCKMSAKLVAEIYLNVCQSLKKKKDWSPVLSAADWDSLPCIVLYLGEKNSTAAIPH